MIAYLASVIILKIVQALPLRSVAILARMVAWLIRKFDPVHRAKVCHNLKIAFGQLDGEKMDALLGAVYERTARNLLYAVWVAGRADAEVKPLYELRGVKENLLPAVAGRKGVIHVMFHHGNWELLSRMVTQIPGLRFSTIYQPLKNPRVEKMVRGWRSCSGVGLINRHDGFQEAVKRLRRSEAVGMLVDQHAGDHGMWVPLFDRFASTTTLPALLARRTGAPIVPIFCHEDAGNGVLPRWIIEFGEEIRTEGRSDGEVLATIHEQLEKTVRQDPASWFWFHDRWKTPSPNILFQSYRRGVFFPKGRRLQPFRILVRTPNWLGDAVLALPAVRALIEGRPDTEVTVWTHPKLQDFWKSQSGLCHVVCGKSEVREQGEFDAVVLMTNSFRTGWEAWQVGIPRRFGYAGHWRRWLLTAVCPESFRAQMGEHEVKDFCGLVRWCGGEVESEVPRGDIMPMAVRDEAPFAVLHPGAAHGSAKRWLPERFVEVVRRTPEIRWKVIGSADEVERNRNLTREMGSQVEDCTGKMKLPELADMLARARVVLCNDSGPMHLAAAVGTPVVAIFGSTEPRHTGPLGEGHRVLHHKVECSPCYLKECPIDLRCMKAVTVDEVEIAVRKVWSQRKA